MLNKNNTGIFNHAFYDLLIFDLFLFLTAVHHAEEAVPAC